MKASVIVATYNRVDALDLVLQSLEQQTIDDFEIIVADDGSGNATKECVQRFIYNSPFKICHVWQEDLGFRLARIRNLATLKASTPYLIFLDGDCIVQPDFVEQHLKLAQPQRMVVGGRILLAPQLTQTLCQNRFWNPFDFKKQAWRHFVLRQINKILPLFIRFPDNPFRLYRQFVWRRIKGCNMGCWKTDALAIGGFDETLVGWGHEDADFVFRLHQHGVLRKSGSWATEVLHLWHKMADKSSAEKNAAIVRQRILAKAKQ